MEHDTRLDDDIAPMAGAGDKPLTGGRIKRVRFRDLPKAEQDVRRVTDAVVYHVRRHNARPTIAMIAGYTKQPHDDIAAALADPVLVANLRTEGVLPPEADTYADAAGDRLQPSGEQIAAVEAILAGADPDVSGSWVAVLRERGISPKQWRGWMRDDVFAAYVRDTAGRLFGDHEAVIDVALLRQAAAGSVPALKLAYELTGRLNPTGGNQTDMMGLVSRLLEILARRLDPATLTLVAEDLEALSGVLAQPVTVPAANVIDGHVTRGDDPDQNMAALGNTHGDPRGEPGGVLQLEAQPGPHPAARPPAVPPG